MGSSTKDRGFISRSKREKEDKQHRRKHNKEDSDSDDESTISSNEDGSDEWSTEDDDEDDQDSESIGEDETSHSSNEMSMKEFEQLLNKMMNKKPSQSSKHCKEDSKQKSKKSKNKKHRNKKQDTDTETEDSDYETDTENDQEMSKEEERDFIIMLNGGVDENDDSEENLNYILENEEDKCDSEDERIFMKEEYQEVEYPKDLVYEKETKKKSKKDSKKLKKNQDKTEEETPKISVVEEYKDLLDLKKHLSAKLKKNPNSKSLLAHMKECCESIRTLVKNSRKQNAKDYIKQIKTEQKNTSTELEYFKNKLSNTEQLQVIEQMKLINEHIHIDKPYRLSLLQTNLPSKYKATVMNKLNIMKSMEPGDNEYHKLKTWVDGFMRIPFNTYKSFNVKMEDGMDVCNQFMRDARNQLDNCVYGHNDAKLQIMQMIGQWIANPSAMGTAIAIHGPPGVGKTLLVKEGISKILGREFAFIALGGAGDSSFLEGHSYTYEGSMWGKIAQILMESKCMNPVIYFDELDKVSDSARGQEIIGVLTHLIDTTQNTQFHDKYFNEVDFDLSKCLFIFSYNDENLVNPILRDRMYKIQTKGYELADKMTIAKKYMLPKIREKVNFKEGEIIIPDDTLQYIISNQKFTQNEQGVRNLNRCLEIIHTKLNLFRLMHVDDNDPILGKGSKIKVEYPFTVKRQDVDALIKNEENQNQSLLAMYV